MSQHEIPREGEVSKDCEHQFDQEITPSDPMDSLLSEASDTSLSSSTPNPSNTAQVPASDAEFAQELSDAHIAHQRRKFNATFEEIIAKESSSARSMFPFIRSKLIQFHLQRRYDEVAILQEVYARTIAKILDGREITNHYAWIRAVAFRYIRELSRKHSRNLNIDTPILELLAPTADINTIDEEFLTDEMLKIRRAFRELSSEEQLLLSLKAVQDLSWAEIQKIWIAEGHGKVSLATLRKRKERALSHLRRLYHSL
ncbi:MAG: sigma-70 family RNA polymerase sigma factor [Cyanobacteria bacterium P01_F01_bin.3]